MFEANCVIVLVAPEISIKSSPVRTFMLAKLKKNILLYLNHHKLEFDSITFFAGRFVIKTNQVSEVISALSKCFGIINLFPVQEISFASLSELKIVSSDLFSGYSTESFAIRGKSFSKEFSSKKLEEELGGVVLEKFPRMRVRLVNPDKEFFCLTKKGTAFFYFDSISGAGGMPVSVQGKSGVIVSDKTVFEDLFLLCFNLLKTGSSIILVTESTHKFDLTKLEEFTGFIKIKSVSPLIAREYIKEGGLNAFFSCERTLAGVDADSSLVGEKVLAPLLF